ncbi:hypothetical protein LUZ60_016556 [Juncus effusus]|nr:hypothetical protein LUZ60_016556 [Juncus effusus]
MEFTLERNSREGETDQEESSPRNQIPFMPSTSSSSPSASPAFGNWSTEPSGAGTGTIGAASTSGGTSTTTYIEKEHMFDKVVTPSDVGKLNRLVIPKQHAEKYFPLDPSSGEKGLLLSFEDRTGKPWRFRYSYWNSSQSYVMTKGWSRFVKEKRLDPGDTVSFGRGVGHEARDKLFIDWKRRADTIIPGRLALPSNIPYHRSVGQWNHGAFYVPGSAPATLFEHHQSRQTFGQQFIWFRSGVPRPNQILPPSMPVVLESVPVSSGQTAAKRVRLFGVNLDSPNSGEGSNHNDDNYNNNNNNSNLLSLRMSNWQSSSSNNIPLIEMPHHGIMNASNSAGVDESPSSSSRKEGHSSLDLDL